MKTRRRLDEHLLNTGQFSDQKEAQAWILCGKVLVDGAVCAKPGTLIRSDSVVTLRAKPPRFASRGGYKLEKALRRFDIAVEDKVVLDAGAAAGGFTDCLLQCGARHVYAVDVGYGQLKGKLATDPRVTNWERRNISDLSQEDFDPPLDFCTADLSFLSLVKALPVLQKLFLKPYSLVCLIKPLFEGLSHEYRGDPDAIAPVLLRFFEEIMEPGIVVAAVTVSPILSTRNTVEFLMFAHNTAAHKSPAQLTDEAVHSMLQEPPVEADLMEDRSG
jgi:23S rRNA (cytidine1920-2'-O)/16S rRNA (cytidine1409-2'-O)-methyltransferase